MGFEYDPAKSDENKRKHGIDFEEALALGDDPALLEIPARASDEPRWLLIGKINIDGRGEKLWSSLHHPAGRECAAYLGEAVAR